MNVKGKEQAGARKELKSSGIFPDEIWSEIFQLAYEATLEGQKAHMLSISRTHADDSEA